MSTESFGSARPPVDPLGAGTAVPSGNDPLLDPLAGPPTYPPADYDSRDPLFSTVPPAPPAQWSGTGSAPSTGGSASSGGSTTDTAKEQAGQVAGDAKEAAGNVVGVAKEQATQVVGEARDQIKQLAGQATSQLTDQAAQQQQRLAGGLQSLAAELRSMAQNSEQPGVATDLAHQAADRAERFGGWLGDRDPKGVLDELRSFARQRPGVFLAAALGAGVVAGRLARGIAADSSDSAPSTELTQPVAAGWSAPASLTAGDGGLASGGIERGALPPGGPDYGYGGTR